MDPFVRKPEKTIREWVQGAHEQFFFAEFQLEVAWPKSVF